MGINSDLFPDVFGGTLNKLEGRGGGGHTHVRSNQSVQQLIFIYLKDDNISGIIEETGQVDFSSIHVGDQVVTSGNTETRIYTLWGPGCHIWQY